MKKILGMLAVAALLMVACDKENHGSQGDISSSDYTTPRLPAPNNAENHFGMSVDQSRPQDGMKTPEGNPAKIAEINLPPGNTGSVSYNDNKAPRAFDYQVSKVASGISFQCNIFERIDITAIEGKTISLTVRQNGEEIALSGTLKDEPAYTAYRQDVCRTWAVEKTFIILKVDGRTVINGVGGQVDGCDLSEITRKLIENGVKIDALSSDYNVKKVMIDPCGKFGIFFYGADAYYGDYTLKGTDFSYKFTFCDEDNPVIAGEATGKLIANNKDARLSITADMQDNSGKKYNVEVTLVLNEPKLAPKAL